MYLATGNATVGNSLRFALRGGLFDLPMDTPGSSRHTVPVFGELQIAYQVVGQTHQAWPAGWPAPSQ